MCLIESDAQAPTAPTTTTAGPAEGPETEEKEPNMSLQENEPPNESGKPKGLAEQVEEEPIVLHVATMSRSDREKVRRIVTPKSTTGRLEVPKDIFELWQTEKGKEKIFSMWCKSGGVKVGLFGELQCFCSLLVSLTFWGLLSIPLKVVFMQRVEILSTTTKSKKIEVKGGFFSENDMKTELGYSVSPGCKGLVLV